MDIHQIHQLAPEIKKIAEKHGILKIFVFGSVARGMATTQSDVDFLVEMQEEASLFGVAGFGYEVGQLLGTRVDVVPLSTLPKIQDKDFVNRIQREAISL